MNYKKLSNEQLQQLKYPNLMAEFIESHYSICTVADHMGLGRRQEDDLVVWGKLRGDIEITCIEAVGLARLFGTTLEYLFSEDLSLLGGDPTAVVRWAETNRRREQEMRDNDVIFKAYNKMKRSPVLLRIVKFLLKLNDDELKSLVVTLEGGDMS